MNQSETPILADLFIHVARQARPEEARVGLSAAQWAALRFFAHANRMSRKASAFADFHGTTRGTASQTIKGLVTRGLLQRRHDPADGRSAVFEVTADGFHLLKKDPARHLTAAIHHLSPWERSQLGHIMRRLEAEISQRETGQGQFGSCHECACYQPGINGENGHCSDVDETMKAADLNTLCSRFQPANPSEP